MTAKIKLNAASGGGSVSLKAPSTTTSNAAVELQLPVADGSADQVLSTNGSGQLAFSTVSVPSAFVSGMIILWSGAANAIPSGFVLCDGNNSTPNLSGKFVVGYHASNGDYDVNDTGGAETVALTEAQMPAHNHHSYITTDSGSPYGHVRAAGNNQSQGAVATTTRGSGNAHENRPPYYALCYIMKT
jgi:hypothetical protein